MRSRDEVKIQQVYDKAVELLVTQGLDGFSMQKLARAAGVSPATLYIYYKDREDLILQVGISEADRMTEATLKGFDSAMSFEEGLWVQWQNRADYWLQHTQSARCYEYLRNSGYSDRIVEGGSKRISAVMKPFLTGAIGRGEVRQLPLEVYWSIAFAPLMSLIRFHLDGRSVGNYPFTFSEEAMRQTFDLVVKALRP